jgi:hypothetical protein
MAHDFENESVLRTNRPTRCRSVVFYRSTCAVSPDSFQHATWPLAAKTFG